MINRLLNMFPIKTDNIESFIKKLEEHNCKKVDVVPDCSSTSTSCMFITLYSTTNWVDYVAKTQDGRTIKLKQKPVTVQDSAFSLISGVLAGELIDSYRQKTELNISLIKKAVPGIEMYYDTSKLERKQVPCKVSYSY
jgi:hypothetical protein